MNKEELLEEIDTAQRTSRRVWDMSNLSLSSLSPPFFDLSSLSVLHLNNNNFSSLSPDFNKLIELNVLDLSSNHISEIPPELCQLSKLTSIFLHNNEINKLPNEFTKLKHLNVLSLGCNRLEREIPREVLSLSNLSSFSCCANKITSFPVDIIKLTRLTSLNLSMNNIKSIPNNTKLPSSLLYLNISTNYFSTLPPSFLSGLSSIKSLNLSYNNIEIFPEEIFQLTTLTSLQIDNNKITTLPIQISEMTHLSSLSLDGNPLSLSILELHRTLKTNLFLFRIKVGAGHSLAHHVHDVVNQQRSELGGMVRLHSASNDKSVNCHPRKVVTHNQELGQLAKITNLDSAEIAKHFDGEDGASMTRQGFRSVAARANYVISQDPALMDAAFDLFDLDGNGTVDIKELVLGFTVLEQGSLKQKLKFGFQLYDINHDGSLERNELKIMLMKIGAMRDTKNGNATAAKIEDFINKVYLEKDVLLFEDFENAAMTSSHIMDLFALDAFFKRKPIVKNNNNNIPSMRRSDSSVYKDPRKMLIKKRETHELAKLTHLQPNEFETLFDLEGGEEMGETGRERREGDSMSRERFRETMKKTGLRIARDPALLDCLFDVFDLDMSGTVERKELLVGLITLNTGTLSQKLKLGFHLYDTNGDGSIEKQELRGMLSKIAALQSRRTSTTLATEIDDFVQHVFAGRKLLLFADFLVAAQSDSHIAQLFALDSIFSTQ